MMISLLVAGLLSPLFAHADLATMNVRSPWRRAQLLSANRPVAGAETWSIAVLPEGVENREQLTGWSAESVVKDLRIQAYGAGHLAVASFPIRLSASWGGGQAGKGHFLADLLAVPGEGMARGDWKCDAWVEREDRTVNLGSAEDPIAGLRFQLEWECSSETERATSSGSRLFFATGLGRIFEL